MMGKNKQMWLSIVACIVAYAAVQTLITLDVIGPFWQLNIVLVCINVILAVS